MKSDIKTDSKSLSIDEYYKIELEFINKGDVNAYLEFIRNHTILYEDPIPKQDIERIKNIEIPELSEVEAEKIIQSLKDWKELE